MRKRTDGFNSPASASRRSARKRPRDVSGSTSARRAAPASPRRVGQCFPGVRRVGPQGYIQARRSTARASTCSRTPTKKVSKGPARLVLLDPAEPSGTRQTRTAARTAVDSIFSPDSCSATRSATRRSRTSGTAAAPAFGSSNPVPQFRCFQSAQMGREGIVRRIEQVMSFVEYVASRGFAIVSHRRRPNDHQGMIGDQPSPRAMTSRCAPLDETALIMGTRGIDAFTSAIGQPRSCVWGPSRWFSQAGESHRPSCHTVARGQSSSVP